MLPLTTATGADGTSECPGVSTHERGEGAEAANPGTSSRPTNPSACGTQVKVCFCGRLSSNDLRSFELSLARVPLFDLSNGTRAARLASGRRGRGTFARTFRTPRSGKTDKTTTASPGASDIRGDEACLHGRRRAV